MIEIFIKSIKDLFDKKILLTSLIPIIIAAFFWGVVFFVFHTQIHNFILFIISHIPFIGTNNFIANLVEAIGGILLYYELLIITSVMIAGIVADKIVNRINEKYYHLKTNGFGSFIGSIVVSLKYNIMFIILFIISLPLMFVPGLNMLVHLILWVILIKEPLFYDSLAMIADKKEYFTIKKRYKFSILVLSFILAALFLIPLFGVFVYIIQLILFTHFNLNKLKEIRNESASAY